ncbi:MAG: hypothetical protein R2695_07545 [Acidimicrobiales bacterium]
MTDACDAGRVFFVIALLVVVLPGAISVAYSLRRFGWRGVLAEGAVVRSHGKVQLRNSRFLRQTLSVVEVANERGPVRLMIDTRAPIGFQLRYLLRTRDQADQLANLLERAAAPEAGQRGRTRVGAVTTPRGIVRETIQVDRDPDPSVRLRVTAIAPIGFRIVSYRLTSDDAISVARWIRQALGQRPT